MNKSKKSQQGFSHVEILAVIVILGIVGFAGWRVADNGNDNTELASQNSQEASNEVESLPADLGSLKPLEEIQTQASQDSSGTSVLGIELENEDGKTVYKVYLADGRVLFYDAFTGLSLQLSGDDNDEFEDGESLPADFVAGISIQEAINIAKQSRPDSTLKKVEIEVEDGIVVYSVRFTDDSRVDVNASDGSIERVKNENNEDNDEDDRDEEDDDDSSDDEDGDEEDEEDDEDEEDEEDDEDEDNSGSGSN